MPVSDPSPGFPLLPTAPAPSTPLGPFEDSAVAWTTWVTLIGFVGLTALALVVAGPAARRAGAAALTATTVRLARAAVVLGALAVPAVLTDLAHGASQSGGYDYGAAWNGLYDGSNDGRLSGLEVTLILAGAALVAPLTVRRTAAGPARRWLLAAGLGAGAVALGTTKFPDKAPDDWGRTVFETAMWMLHLIGGSVWLGGLAGLALIALPGAVAPAARGAFWPPALRRFSAAAMSCVAAIALSGLFLYWEHVDGPGQLVSTMYGRVLGVKILVFGALLLLGAFNQFWLHPRLEGLRAAGDLRPLRTVLVREFPAVVAVETLLGAAVLFVAPFLHGSARNQAYQARLAEHAGGAAALGDLPKLPAKEVSTSTWVWGTAETLAVLAVMAAGYWLSGVLARRRTATAVPLAEEDLVEA
ncbi:copper resistance D family protein [Actinacidiphila acididurans]|uniref:CopD family protein n=1 Tax=Actinacidiphila acididurans TaxID=2784346 RepID=A0ABS2TNC3_9ACTN|nr:CopD family protein [Actinacidiphila acididurans]MBM9504322.1 CopD family protein [Actinacidiphila acididurans]